MRKALQFLLTVTGVSVIAIALLHIAIGPVCIPGSIPVNATLDSEDRFYATMFLAYGAFVLWSARDVQHKTQQVKRLALVFFVGGLARVASASMVGLPHPFFIAMGALELTFPWLLIWLATRVSRAANLSRPLGQTKLATVLRRRDAELRDQVLPKR
jgi:hypothetical protein